MISYKDECDTSGDAYYSDHAEISAQFAVCQVRHSACSVQMDVRHDLNGYCKVPYERHVLHSNRSIRLHECHVLLIGCYIVRVVYHF